jgi:hypothetical protein
MGIKQGTHVENSRSLHGKDTVLNDKNVFTFAEDSDFSVQSKGSCAWNMATYD